LSLAKLVMRPGRVEVHADQPTNPFKRRHFPGEGNLLCVRWYLRYLFAYEHVAELLAARGVEVDSQLHLALREAYAPELNKR